MARDRMLSFMGLMGRDVDSGRLISLVKWPCRSLESRVLVDRRVWSLLQLAMTPQSVALWRAVGCEAGHYQYLVWVSP